MANIGEQAKITFAAVIVNSKDRISDATASLALASNTVNPNRRAGILVIKARMSLALGCCVRALVE